jgi:adenosylhomocysteine nucleosidase
MGTGNQVNLLASLAARQPKRTKMDTVGLLAAMDQEGRSLLRVLPHWSRVRLGPRQCFSFQLGNHDCLLLISGMGRLKAASAARLLIADAAPQLLISFGTAGAPQDTLEIGDVISAGQWCALDEGHLGPIHALARLSAPAWQSAAQALLQVSARLLPGTVVTTSGSQQLMDPSGWLPGQVLEMETAGIAQVANENRIPLLSLRSVSDNPSYPLPFDLDQVMDQDSRLRIDAMLRMILHHPGLLSGSRRLRVNTRLACEHAAAAVYAVLKAPGVLQED